MILDCGHDEDTGRPATVIKDGKPETVQGWTWTYALDGKRRICHRCASEQVLDCGHAIGAHDPVTSGYGTEPNTGRRLCFKCCGLKDEEAMRKTGRITLYLSGQPGFYKLTNWPGTLKIAPYRVRKGRHNIAGSRYDVWFSFNGQEWHGVQYGENTQLCHCKVKKN